MVFGDEVEEIQEQAQFGIVLKWLGLP